MRRDYLQEVQKFTSSQYWYSGLRITAGVMVPLIIFSLTGSLRSAVPFLWGALFVSLTDTPGPIHHRRNGMLAAILLNAAVVLLTGFTRDYQTLLIIQIIVLGLLLTMLGVYGARAGAVGTLALLVMLLNLLSANNDHNSLRAAAMIGGGGVWYMGFSMLLHGIRPYRPVEQVLGEHLIAIADYIRARGGLYKENADLSQAFHRVMRSQTEVRSIQSQTEELLFRTRRLVADASPKSRSLMMIYLDSLDLFEQTMHSYQDYEHIHRTLDNSGLLNRYYGLILELAAGLEHIGITVQMGNPVRRHFDINKRIDNLRDLTIRELNGGGSEQNAHTLEALTKILKNAQEISNRMNRLILYTRLEGAPGDTFEIAEKTSRLAASQPLKLKVFTDNLTFKSDTFRHAVRLTVAMMGGYVVSIGLGLTHSYWVLLTILAIQRPAYVLTKQRNVQRVAGTLVGVVVVSALMLFISNSTVLVVILVASMLIGYSLLRVHYFGFVVFLTIFLVISLYFLNPFEFPTLIRERLIDTVIGSVIAFLASRFIFPVWGHREIKESMMKMLETNRQYFYQAWIALSTGQSGTHAYNLARQAAMVSLSNLSENFQQMLSEPNQPRAAAAIHQFVIANHMLTGYIAALSEERSAVDHVDNEALEELSRAITYELQCAEDNLRDKRTKTDFNLTVEPSLSMQTLTQLSMIYSLAHDIRKITARISGLS